MTREQAENAVYIAISVGEGLLQNGAEAGRVEDTVSRILTAYGATRADVFSITSSLVVTAHFGDFNTITQTRRITSLRTDMERVCQLNQLSRDICNAVPVLTPEEALPRLKNIFAGPDCPEILQILGYALVSGSFTVFFGGDAADSIEIDSEGDGLVILLNVVMRFGHSMQQLSDQLSGKISKKLRKVTGDAPLSVILHVTGTLSKRIAPRDLTYRTDYEY